MAYVRLPKMSWCNQRYILVVYLPAWDVRTSDVENYDLVVYSVLVQPAPGHFYILYRSCHKLYSHRPFKIGPRSL